MSRSGAASATRELHVGGVPEHFNFPWYLAIESGRTDESGFKLTWSDYSTGTGAMLDALTTGELDVATLLTEGAALGLARDCPIVALSLYTHSPLLWGVHVAPDSEFRAIESLAGARFAISRPGSGSHLMSLAMAIEYGWPLASLDFVVVDNLPGAVEAFGQGRADVFLWEHFTTEPFVESGQFRRVGDFRAPWPAWVICANRDFASREGRALERLVRVIGREAQQLSHAADAAERIASRFGLEPDAVSEWLGQTRWVDGPTSPDAALADARRMLERADAI